MRISTRGRYALRVVLDLARHDKDGFVSLKSISQRQEVSVKYLEAIVALLNKAGIVTSQRGKDGGYRLARKPGDISAFDILSEMETSLRSVPCQSGGECPRKERCESKAVWDKVSGTLESTLKAVSLKDLATIYRGVQGVFIG